VFWLDPSNGTVNALPKGSQSVVTLATFPSTLALAGSASSITVDEQNVYWGTAYGGIHQIPITGGTPQTLAGATTPASLVVVAGQAFWTEWQTQGWVMSVPLQGGAPVAVAQNQLNPWGLATDGQFLYWVNQGNWDACDFSGTLMRANLDGSAPVVLAANLAHPLGVAVDSTHVYWTEEGYGNYVGCSGTGAVMRMPLGGGAPEQVAAGKSGPSVLSLDAHYVYWLDWNGGFGTGIMAAPK
jgi:hypothetical protein